MLNLSLCHLVTVTLHPTLAMTQLRPPQVLVTLKSLAPRLLYISKSAKVSGRSASTHQAREPWKSHANSPKSGLHNGSMAYLKDSTPERWEGRPTHAIPCNPCDISWGLYWIRGAALSNSVNILMLTFRGEPGIFNFVSPGGLDKPVGSGVRIERVCAMVTCWHQVCYTALKGV